MLKAAGGANERLTVAATVLLTGFEPFGGESVNPSWQVAEALHGQTVAGATVSSLCLPCVFDRSRALLEAALDAHRPRVVLALGLAASRSEISVERVAINVDDARIADNAGARPVDVPVVAGAPAAYFATLPIKAIVAALVQAGLPAAVSQSAGTYVCNHVFYGLLHALRGSPAVRAGFIHLPLLTAQAVGRGGAGGLALEAMVHGVRVALGIALTAAADLRTSGGRED